MKLKTDNSADCGTAGRAFVHVLVKRQNSTRACDVTRAEGE